MKKQKWIRKGMAFVLSLAMVAGLVPAMSGGANTVKAASGSGTEPSVSAYATKAQLMDGTFDPDSGGNATNIGKLVFGKNQSGTPQEWYILGKDTGVSGDNTIIFAASPIATNQVFENDWHSNKTYDSSFGVYTSNPTDVYPNHYGASDLRVALKNMATSETYFTSAEQGLMNATTVTTNDTKNSATYTTTDKLYALAADGSGSSYKTIKAGTSDSTVLAKSRYWSSGDWFWLRSPRVSYGNEALLAGPGYCVYNGEVKNMSAVQPASNLNLSSVLFASAATAASSDTAESGIIAEGTAMTLRFDGTGKNIGAAIYNAETGTIEIRRGGTSQTVALVVQGNDGTNDWYYSKKITATETVNASEIKSALGLSEDIDLSVCKIWLEITDTDGLIYAVCADKEIKKINTTYVTKEQLMNSFKPYSDGTAVNYGKLVFGKNSSGTAQKWYILGKDTGVLGDNTIIFAASPIATGQKFEDDSENNKTESSLWSDCDYSGKSITEVYPNHYGASDLRVALQGMATNTSYFTTAEQGLMNATTVTTNDTKNSATYTTTDKLYALAADGTGMSYQTIKAGTSDSTVLAMDSYWSSGDWFWLRSPCAYGDSLALLADPGDYVLRDIVHGKDAVQPASNLNLSSVLFASAATAASSDTAESGTIAEGTAMTLRLDTSATTPATAVGTVIYDASDGVIAAQKNADATGTVSLVVQGKGTIGETEQDWYYSVPVGGTIVVTKEQIQQELSLSAAPNLADCQIWLETTIDNVAYASTAEAVGTIQVEKVNSVAVTDVKPVGGEAFNTAASCNTKGIASITPAITYTTAGENGEKEVTGIADWNTTYKAAFTLTTGIVNNVAYVFGDSVSVTVDEESLSNALVPNVDGTVTVTREFTTAKRKIVSVAAPEVPTDNTFTTYYGYKGYTEVLSNGGNNELGKQATVTLEGTGPVPSTTEDMDVIWTVANAGGAPYDKTPGAENTFRWTIPASEFPNYDASACQGYDAATGDITDTVTITNKAATPVTITGTDSGIAYTGATIDVSDYFDIDTNAGAATYSLVTGVDGGTGMGTLSGTTLTVTKTGTFKIKVETLANGIYGAGEKTITLTVSNGTVVAYDKASAKVEITDVTKKEVTYKEPVNKKAKTVTIPATVKINGVTYKVTKIADNAFKNNKTVTKVTVGSNIKTIGKNAFYKCTKLKTVKIGKNVTSIGSNAFYGCSKLTSVTVGSNVTTISEKAFYKCTSLTKITIPSKVKKIGKQTFYGCKKLKTITIKTTKLTRSKVGSKAFKGIYSKATIKVPKSKLTSYKKILKAKGVSSKAKIKK